MADRHWYCIATCGLPARGKTFIARKIARWLDWLGYTAKIFNVGNYRRQVVGTHAPHDFFDPNNADNVSKRDQIAKDWFEEMERASDLERGKTHRAGGSSTVAVFDATNSVCLIFPTFADKRETKGNPRNIICDDIKLIRENVQEVKVSSPDYLDVDPQAAVDDFMQRIKHYEDGYETITPEEGLSFVKTINVGTQFVINEITGYLPSRVVYFLMNLNISATSFYLSRHGESVFNVRGLIGGDSDLSERGKEFSIKLPAFFDSLLDKDAEEREVTVWVSTLKRTVQTSKYLPYSKQVWKQLDELDPGDCDGLSYQEIEEKFPQEFAARDKDKYNGNGESYHDLVQRLEPVIMELERMRMNRTHTVFIIGHQAVLRCIYAYFMNFSKEELPYLKIPLHTIFKLTPKAYGCHEERFPVDVPATDTFRAKPKDTDSPSVSPILHAVNESIMSGISNLNESGSTFSLS